MATSWWITHFEAFVKALIGEGGYLASSSEAAAIERVMWDERGHRLADTVACPPQDIAARAGIAIPADRRFIIVENREIGPEHNYSREKLTTLLAVYCYEGFENVWTWCAGSTGGGQGAFLGIYRITTSISIALRVSHQ